MKVCNAVAIVVILLAVSLIAMLTTGLVWEITGGKETPAPEAPKPTVASLHYAVEDAVSQETMMADMSALLKIPADVEPIIIGSADAYVPGRYKYVCSWEGGNDYEVEVCIYDNSFSYSVDNRPIVDGAVSLYLKDAIATENFTKGITVKDSLGNVISAVKSNDSMSFNNEAGTYSVTYTATDAVGHVFSFALDYIVTYPFAFNIENSNVVARISESSVIIDIDFDGAPLDKINLWVEDASGKKIAGIYSTIREKVDKATGEKTGEWEIVLRSHYYKKFAGQTIELSICSNYGKATFYVTVLDE